MEGNGKACDDWQFTAFCYHTQHKVKPCEFCMQTFCKPIKNSNVFSKANMKWKIRKFTSE